MINKKRDLINMKIVKIKKRKKRKIRFNME